MGCSQRCTAGRRACSTRLLVGQVCNYCMCMLAQHQMTTMASRGPARLRADVTGPSSSPTDTQLSVRLSIHDSSLLNSSFPCISPPVELSTFVRERAKPSRACVRACL